ncbi:amino acid ABC transporter substrate-binding protein [Bosea sp. BIWAKO-01]|uniref:amino acid ABC transporter substrate-binding protein n=1 Tax=Bosea sp. BIWAKO-01 TaxID=506668 RepID=UPI00085299E3|nr:amino acid ABC transporter substrate-binding protein [Bosea sp. BIWAKO-01]GAU84763.1 glutamate aspartate periplasmic binding protein precursor GltI [Bosea sp. BIWAKO-01]
MLKKTAVGSAIIGAVFALITGSASAQALYGTLKKIKDSGTIIIGHNEDSPPFAYFGADGKPQGYSIDICNKIADAVKAELKMDSLTVKYQAVNGQTRTPLLVNGTVDLVCATTTNTFSRQQQIDFLNTMFVTGNRLLVKKNSGIKEIEDLKGKVVSANQGTTNEKVLNELNQKLNLGIKVLSTKDQPQGWIALETDRTDAHMTDEVVEYGLIAKSKNPADYAVVGRLLSFDPYAIVIRRDDSAFRSLGNKVLANLYRTGEWEQIYTKWMSTIGQPLSPDLKLLMSMQNYPD